MQSRRKLPPPVRRSPSPRARSPGQGQGMQKGARKKQQQPPKKDMDYFQPPKLLTDNGFFGTQCYRNGNGTKFCFETCDLRNVVNTCCYQKFRDSITTEENKMEIQKVCNDFKKQNCLCPPTKFEKMQEGYQKKLKSLDDLVFELNLE